MEYHVPGQSEQPVWELDGIEDGDKKNLWLSTQTAGLEHKELYSSGCGPCKVVLSEGTTMDTLHSKDPHGFKQMSLWSFIYRLFLSCAFNLMLPVPVFCHEM